MTIETQEAVTCITCRTGRGTLLRCARCGYASHRACGRRTACPVSAPTMPCVHRFFSKAARVQATLTVSPLDQVLARVFSARTQSQLAKLDLPMQSKVFVELLDMVRWAEAPKGTVPVGQEMAWEQQDYERDLAKDGVVFDGTCIITYEHPRYDDFLKWFFRPDPGPGNRCCHGSGYVLIPRHDVTLGNLPADLRAIVEAR